MFDFDVVTGPTQPPQPQAGEPQATEALPPAPAQPGARKDAVQPS